MKLSITSIIQCFLAVLMTVPIASAFAQLAPPQGSIDTNDVEPQALQSQPGDDFPSEGNGWQSLDSLTCTSTIPPQTPVAINMQGALNLNYVLEFGTGLERTVGGLQISLDARPLRDQGLIVVQIRPLRATYAGGLLISFFPGTRLPYGKATPQRQWKMEVPVAGDQIACFHVAPLGTGYWYANVEA